MSLIERFSATRALDLAQFAFRSCAEVKSSSVQLLCKNCVGVFAHEHRSSRKESSMSDMLDVLSVLEHNMTHVRIASYGVKYC